MAEWLSAAGDDQPPAKTRAVGSTSSESQNTQLTHMILTLQTQQTRQQAAATWHSFLGPRALAEDAVATTKDFAQRTKGQSGHKFGSPHVQAWKAFTDYLHKRLTKTDALPSVSPDQLAMHKKVLLEHIAKFEKAGPAQGFQFISQFRARITKDDKAVINYTLSQYIEPNERFSLDLCLKDLLTSWGAEYRAGAPPASDAERRLQKAVDEVFALHNT